MYNRVKAMVTLSIMVLCLTGCDARTSIVDIVTGEENDKQSAYESSSSVTDDTTSRNYEEQSEENSNETKTDSTEKDSMQSDSYSRDDSDTYDANQEEEKTDEQNTDENEDWYDDIQNDDWYDNNENEELDTVDSEYIIPDSDTRRITNKDLKGLSKEECRLARNEIYARHGRMFNDSQLQDYFDSQPWYEGTTAPDYFNESELSKIEKDNVKKISKYEKRFQ